MLHTRLKKVFLGLFLSIFWLNPTSSQTPAKNWQSLGENGRQQQNLEIKARLKKSQRYISLGQFRRAIEELKQMTASNSASSSALIHEKLGNAYSGLGQYEQAISAYEKSIDANIQISALNNLVKTLQDRLEQIKIIFRANSSSNATAFNYRQQITKEQDRIIKYARKAVDLGRLETSASSVRALIQWHNLVSGQLNKKQFARGNAILGNLPRSRSTVFLMMNWSQIDLDNREQWLRKAEQIATSLDDPYAYSYVALKLGSYYQDKRELQNVLEMTRKAQNSAQLSLAYDSLFRSQRLAGWAYSQIGNRTEALKAYRSSINTIDIINQSTVTSRAGQISKFNREIEPIYRETLLLLLNNPQSTSEETKEALLIFDKLRLAQLRDYFGDNCFSISDSYKQDSIGSNTASISSIILEDRTYFILQLPSGETFRSEAKIDKQELINSAIEWQGYLSTRNNWKFSTQSRLFYDLIIKPFEAKLEAADLETLVFVHDGILRNLPMPALSDGENYLAQKWASVTSIGMSFTRLPKEVKDSKALAFGLERSTLGWSPLDNVEQELNSLINLYGGDLFINQNFTVDNLNKQLDREDYSILHLATHGYFGGSADTSFVLAYDQKISAIKLEEILLQSPQIIDMLVLSACETAVGNELAVLGLAGIAARGRVSSVLGSLWTVQDQEQSEIITNFYSYLTDDSYNKATALQRVQIEQIKLFAHPQKWAALSLIGDWQQ